MRVLVLGFSVTAETPGYVEIASKRVDESEGIEFVKVGLAGLQPHHAQYLFPSIIKDANPDVLVLDHSTPAFRSFHDDREEYRRSMLNVVRECHFRKIRLAIVDFPRTDVDYSDDWVTACNLEISQNFDIAHDIVPLKEGILRDEVHPTDDGREYYADLLLSIINRAERVECSPDAFSEIPHYDAYLAGDLVDPEKERVLINRGGLPVSLVEIKCDETLVLEFGSPTLVRGFSALMGPRTGRLKFQVGEAEKQQVLYDKFCYYDRVGALLLDRDVFSKSRVTECSVTQLAGLPEAELLKGERNTDDRVGAIGHIFVEK